MGAATAADSPLQLVVDSSGVALDGLLPGGSTSGNVLLRNTGSVGADILLRAAGSANGPVDDLLHLDLTGAGLDWHGTLTEFGRVTEPIAAGSLAPGGTSVVHLKMSLAVDAGSAVQGRPFTARLLWTLQSVDGGQGSGTVGTDVAGPGPTGGPTDAGVGSGRGDLAFTGSQVLAILATGAALLLVGVGLTTGAASRHRPGPDPTAQA